MSRIDRGFDVIKLRQNLGDPMLCYFRRAYHNPDHAGPGGDDPRGRGLVTETERGLRQLANPSVFVRFDAVLVTALRRQTQQNADLEPTLVGPRVGNAAVRTLIHTPPKKMDTECCPVILVKGVCSCTVLATGLRGPSQGL